MQKELNQAYLKQKHQSDDQDDFIGRLLFQLVENSKKNEENPQDMAKALGDIETVTIKGAPGEPGQPGYTPQKGKDYFDGKTPQKYVDYFTQEEVESIIKVIQEAIEIPRNGENGFSPQAGIDYPTHEQVEHFVKNNMAMLPTPKDGKTPKHEWNKDGVQVRFENSDGTWGAWSGILKGASGKAIYSGGGRQDLSDYAIKLDAIAYSIALGF
ncbi:MAG: hypothetical protein WC823_00220 [Parcubacteria group bacterium]|jgi:hypothetical protein